jgi:hypothetical protein
MVEVRAFDRVVTVIGMDNSVCKVTMYAFGTNVLVGIHCIFAVLKTDASETREALYITRSKNAFLQKGNTKERHSLY